MSPAIEQLRRLCRIGFTGERLFKQDGRVDLVLYTRDFEGVREVVVVYNEHQALCGYVVAPASMAAPVGRPCERCTAVVTAHQPAPTTAPFRRRCPSPAEAVLADMVGAVGVLMTSRDGRGAVMG